MEKEADVIFVGKKTTMTYVMGALQLINDGATRIVLKARGKLIPRAVDTAEVLRNRFVTEADVESVVIGTEKITNEEGTRNVSTIDVTIMVPK